MRSFDYAVAIQEWARWAKRRSTPFHGAFNQREARTELIVQRSVVGTDDFKVAVHACRLSKYQTITV